MITRFCLYSVFKNLRFFEPFFVLFLLSEPTAGGPGLRYFQVGTLVGYQKLLTSLLEIPLGAATDRFGRRRALVACFTFYVGAFSIFALSSRMIGLQQLLFLYAGQTLFGIGEALRTGSHKAIMLDWMEETGRIDSAAKVLGLTRFFSKASLGLSAMVGGLVVWQTGRFDGLFWMAAAGAVFGIIVVHGYPRWLEGEQSRQSDSGQSVRLATRLATQYRDLWKHPGMILLMTQSILFESQVKVAQHYIQPFFKEALEKQTIAIAGGVGALVVGAYYLVQDLLGGTASLVAGSGLSRRLGDDRLDRWILLITPVFVAAVAVSLGLDWLIAGALGFISLAILQNLRRPSFVALFNQVIDKPQRATSLSIESQLRSSMVALATPVTGLIADRYGLPSAVFSVAILLALNWVFALKRRS